MNSSSLLIGSCQIFTKTIAYYMNNDHITLTQKFATSSPFSFPLIKCRALGYDIAEMGLQTHFLMCRLTVVKWHMLPPNHNPRLSQANEFLVPKPNQEGEGNLKSERK